MRSAILTALLLLSVVTWCEGPAAAASGDLDPTFGTAGIARAAFGGSAGASLARQADGKIVIAGAAGTFGTSAIAVARFDATGAPDPTFNGTGQVTTDIGAFHDGAVQVLLQADGKIVVVGSTATDIDATDSDIVVVRYKGDGTLDGTFGSGGIATTDLGVAIDTPFAGALQADGKILVVGGAESTGTPSDAFVIRYAIDGTIDGTFGTGGVVTLDFGGRNDEARAVLLQPDGKIVVAGTSFNGPFFLDGGVATLTRLDAMGTPDPSFGSGGSVVVADDTINLFNAVLRQPDGKLVTLGATGPLGVTFRLFRFSEAGSPDGAFLGAAVPFSLTNVNPDSLALAPDGKFLVSGFLTPGFQVARMKADGSVDTGFGIAGAINDTVGVVSTSQSVVVEPGLDILVGGTSMSDPGGMNEATVVRIAGTSASCASDAGCGVCERCGTGGTCEIGPRGGCAATTTGASKLGIATKGFLKATVSVSWRGAVPAVDPTTSDDLGICLYQPMSGTPHRILKAVAPAGGTCGTQPCWSGTFATRLKYRDVAGTPDGVQKALISSTRVAIKATGHNLITSAQGVPDPISLNPFAPPVTLQVHASNGTCTTATFGANRAVKPGKFKGKSD